MPYNPATDIPDLSEKVFLITGGKLFTNAIAIPAMVLLVLDDLVSCSWLTTREI